MRKTISNSFRCKENLLSTLMTLLTVDSLPLPSQSPSNSCLPLLDRPSSTCYHPLFLPNPPSQRRPTTLGQTLFARNKVKGNKGHTQYWKLEQVRSKSLFSASSSQVSVNTTLNFCADTFKHRFRQLVRST